MAHGAKPTSSFFFVTSLGHWQEGLRIEGNEESYSLNSSAVATGLGAGYVFPFPSLSLVVQTQATFALTDVGFGPGNSTPVTFQGKNLSQLGNRFDVTLLSRLSQRVAVGCGVPIVTTFFLNPEIAPGYHLEKSPLVKLGFFVDLRIVRNNKLVFNPKIGFLNNLQNYFAIMDFQFHL
ncbi:MAG: hypothetical protein EBZ49_13130 [Proteobacteria bacterium]|nr:hypothetical protein [Pseudomonadota bacterium]